MIDKGFITYQGARPDRTIVHLIDGSTVGMEGDKTDSATRSIGHGEPIVVHQPDGSKIIVNPAHIIGAVYTPPLSE